MTDEMFKPGYDGERPSANLSPTEKERYLLAKRSLVDRLHTAMLCLAVQGGKAELGVRTGSVPNHIVEFGDRVGLEAVEVPRARFKPTPAQVSDVGDALALLEGLMPQYFKVVFLRALHDFQEENQERGEWPWEMIGAYFRRSERWAMDAYDAVIVTAARRSGILPMFVKDAAVVVTSVFVDGGWMTFLTCPTRPLQDLSNLKSKSPVRLQSAWMLWTVGRASAKAISDEARKKLWNRRDHGSWFKVPPDVAVQELILAAQRLGHEWQTEDIDLRGVEAA